MKLMKFNRQTLLPINYIIAQFTLLFLSIYESILLLFVKLQLTIFGITQEYS